MIADAIQHGLRSWWAPLLAFAAGVLSFASPCVLPLVPGYLSFVTGEEAVVSKDGGDRRARLLPILLFILGFSTVFTLVFGFAGSQMSRWVRSVTGQRVAGGVVFLSGVFMLLYAARIRLPWLYAESRPMLSRVRPGPAAAFPLGMAFAAGWTPCIGPVLAGIVVLAGGQGGTARSLLLLFVYSLGLGIPFLLIGVGMGRLMGAMRFVSRNYRWFAGVSGVALMAIGVLLMTGAWTRMVAPLFRLINRFTPAL